MNKDELSDLFEREDANILVQGYKHGGTENPHPTLERENSFGKSNKTPKEASDYRMECTARGVNRFIVVYEKPTNSRVPMPEREIINQSLMNIVYDYMKDYCGIQDDVSGKHISTAPNENAEDYTFETLARNTKGTHKIVIHVSKDMEGGECMDFYSYLSETSRRYSNVRFLVLDQKKRGIEMMTNFEVMRWNQ